MPAHDPDILTADRQKAILALLSEPTIVKAADSVGIDHSTLYRWLKEPEFSKAYREARRESFRHAIALTQKYAPIAVQALVKIVADPKSADSAKVSASTALLKFSRESIELDDVVQRVEALEQATQKQASEPGRAA